MKTEIIFKDTSQRLRFRDTRNLRERNIDDMMADLRRIGNEINNKDDELDALRYSYESLSRDIMMKRWLDDLEDYDNRGYDLNKIIYDKKDYSLKPKNGLKNEKRRFDELIELYGVDDNYL